MKIPDTEVLIIEVTQLIVIKMKRIYMALLGGAISVAVSYSLTKSTLSYSTDLIAGTSQEVSNNHLDLKVSNSGSQIAWKIFNWKIWDAAGDVIKAGAASLAGALATNLIKKSNSLEMVDITTKLLYQHAVDQKQEMLNELN